MAVTNHRHLEIEFASGARFFTSGTNVAGNVKLTLRKPTALCCVRVQVCGRAHTKWTEGHDNDTTVEARRTYLERTLTLWSKPSVDSAPSFVTGTHAFAFSFALPTACPSSFEGKYGHVRYELEAIVERAGGTLFSSDYRLKRGFRVVRSVDLNAFADAGCVLENTASRAAGAWCCCQQSELKLHVSLPRCGYALGEQLPVTATLKNEGSERLEAIHFSLVQRSTFVGVESRIFSADKTHCKRKNQIVSDACKVGALVDGEVIVGRLRVPRATPTTASAAECDLVQIRYVVAVELVLASVLASNLTVELPVVVGTIPLHGDSRAARSSGDAPDYESLLPLSRFEAAAFGHRSGSDDDDAPPPYPLDEVVEQADASKDDIDHQSSSL